MFFAWSPRSSVPFSGYVNTEGTKRKQMLQESSHNNLKNKTEGCHFISWIIACTSLLIAFPHFHVLSQEMLLLPPQAAFCATSFEPPQPLHMPGQHLSFALAGNCMLKTLSHVAVFFLGAEAMSFILLDVSQYLYLGWWVRYNSGQCI